MKVLVQAGPAAVSVLINDLPHLILRRDDLVGLQTWIRDRGTRDPIYYIDFVMRGGANIRSDYDNRALWSDILTQLAAQKLFEHDIGEPSHHRDI